MAALSCGTDALMFGSLMMLASGRLASSPSSVSQSGTRWAAVRPSGKLARMRPAREMSAVSMAIPVPPVNFRMIGSRECVASAGASSISVQTILPGAVAMLQRGLLVAVGVAFDGHRHRQGRDVTGKGGDVDPQRRRVAAVALRADAQAVGALEQLLLQRVEEGVGVGRADLPQEGLLREEGGLLERPAHADPQDQRRAGVGARHLHALDDEVLHTLEAGRRRQHGVLRAVLTAPALGHDGELQIRAGRHLHVDHGRGVVAGVHAVEWRLHHRRAQETLRVALAHALVDRVIEAAARDVHVLAQLDEADGHARVLAVGDALGPGDLRVLLQDLEDLAAGGRALGGERSVEGAQHLAAEVPVGLHAELLDRVGDRGDVDVAHQPSPFAIWAMAALARSAICFGGTSSLWVARPHWLPYGSSSLPR